MSIDKDKIESLIIDYIDGKLNSVDRQVVEQELVNNADAYRRYEQLKEVMHAMDRTEPLKPSENLKLKFDQFLENELSRQKKSKTVFFTTTWYRAAAAVALLIVGGGIGYWISMQNKHDRELMALQKEMELTRQLVLQQLNNDQSASQRILGVQAAYNSVHANKPDDKIVDALVTTMNNDSNSNVRLAAIEALSKFVGEEKVRKALIESLSAQTDPVVQIALIQLMVQMKEKAAVESFKEIINDDKSLPAVKDEAHVGIFKLS